MMVVVGGVGAIGGALFGGLVLGAFPVMDSVFVAANVGCSASSASPVTSLTKIMPGLIGVSLGRNPAGATADMSEAVRPLSASPLSMVLAAASAIGVWILARTERHRRMAVHRRHRRAAVGRDADAAASWSRARASGVGSSASIIAIVALRRVAAPSTGPASPRRTASASSRS